ncbi:MAG: hypothetical protein QT08_C0011G0009 [archaeon GW2011_AR17]|nr:MAG: hypothetical protein QT08_C0011G0009 [archaeon GW2011_AR17]MBS3154467.1 GNAT family N-acetyltransferase [Candidatus Woesearchaeota archaeon]HIH15114.1 GNAT family N-acetyltransferase [Nanoarchaeota archaeon]HIH59398.1 GNAT family N-acetyltransferase [Nanoarchaeota archaeon]HII14514.1 GNAT family N-acetyltransferase [Nanoarchaeota archaeon]
MDFIDVFYKGFQRGEYSVQDIARAFSHQPINPEELEGKNYDSTFLSIVLKRSMQVSFCSPKPKISLTGVVRFAQKDEKDVVENLFDAFQRELYGKVQDTPPEDVLVLEHFEEDLRSLELSVFPAGISGALWYQIHDRDVFFVHSLYVRPEMRSFHCGRKLLEETMNEYATDFGCRSIALRSPEEVVPFYKKLGFSYDPKKKNEAGTCRSLFKRIV